MRRLGRSTGGICQEHKRSRLGRLFRKGIVKDQPEHTPAGDIVGPDGYLVGLALAVPFYRDEALLRELVLRRAAVSFGKEACLGVGCCA